MKVNLVPIIVLERHEERENNCQKFPSRGLITIKAWYNDIGQV